MVGVQQKEVSKTTIDSVNGTYSVPAPLVHRVIIAIVSVLFVTSGSIVAWWVRAYSNDQLVNVRLNTVEQKISKGILNDAQRQIDLIKQRDDFLFDRIEAIEHRTARIKNRVEEIEEEK